MVEEFDPDPEILPSELLTAIGLAVASAAQTENYINFAIGACLGLDLEYQIAVTQHMALPLKFSVLRAVAEIRFDDVDALDELDDLLTSVETALQKRHAIVHDCWVISDRDNKPRRFSISARNSVRVKSVKVTVEEVIRDAKSIASAGYQLMNFIGKHLSVPNVVPGRSRFHKTRAVRKKRHLSKPPST